MDLTVNTWTRSKNDAMASAYCASRNNDVFKHITYAPDYLQQGSCLAGNHANCVVVHEPRPEEEQRLGKLTNLNELQRASTNKSTLGILTTPPVMSGRLVDLRMLDSMSELEWTATHASRIDVPASSQMNEHQLLHSVHTSDAARAPPVPLARTDLRVSTRVARRNKYAALGGCKAA
eukprot:3423991-Pleurochrysis_carterae.AAC.1